MTVYFLEKQVRRTCWRSIKWKIAILCCSTQSRKGIVSYMIKDLYSYLVLTVENLISLNMRSVHSNWVYNVMTCSAQNKPWLGAYIELYLGGGCNNIFLITFLLSQVYLLHRFGLHRKDQFDQLTNQKRSYPIPQNLQLENSNLPGLSSELRAPENADGVQLRTVNIKPDRLLFQK